MKNLLVLAAMISLTACGSHNPECAWSKRIIGSDGWEVRWTAPEMRQIGAHNEMVTARCR